ncbi:hypothetical protein [Streptomyces sp. KHY 26]|uniref:hypothetical protein n=1 Tax=Streptomyces sp. KHY 26 TaxID=3097359 RepID=UPI00376F26D2
MTITRSATRKLPEVTLAFWIMKIAATTLGETAGDLFSQTLRLGYFPTTLALFLVFVVTLVIQLRSAHYQPFCYWTVILSTSMAGTTLSDFMNREADWAVPAARGGLGRVDEVHGAVRGERQVGRLDPFETPELAGLRQVAALRQWLPSHRRRRVRAAGQVAPGNGTRRAGPRDDVDVGAVQPAALQTHHGCAVHGSQVSYQRHDFFRRPPGRYRDSAEDSYPYGALPDGNLLFRCPACVCHGRNHACRMDEKSGRAEFR